jgi:hypothetical protein
MFGKNDPAKKLANDLEAARASRVQLIERRTQAEAKLLEQKEAAKQLAHDGADDAALDRVERAARATVDRISTLTAALADREQQIATLEKEQATLVDKRMRAETSSELEKRRDRFLLGHEALDRVLAEFVEATAAVAEVCLDAQGLLIFSRSARDELRPAVALVAREMNARVAATLDGRAPAALPTQTPRLLEPPPKAPAKLETFFTLAHVMFTDSGTGMLRRTAKYSFVDLTPEQSAHGIRLGAICARDDARIRGLIRQQTSQQPPEEYLCASLDTGEPPVGDPGLLAHRTTTGGSHTVFTPVNRGGPRTLVVPRDDTADTATRSAADGIEER